jgi:carbon-monoxide dehydrogenase medium subunit
MKPAPFDYHAPETLEEALELLAAHGDDARLLAGGQSLVPMMNLRLARFEHLVDINGLGALRGVTRSNETVTVGAVTRQSAVLASQPLAETVPLVVEATRLVGHFQTRNRGTVGGSLAHADPTAELAATALVLDAEVEIASTSGRRTIATDDLLSFAYVTTLAPEEVLVAVHYPVASARSGHSIREVSRRHGDFAVAGATANVVLRDDGTVSTARVVLFAVGPRAQRCARAEEALTGARTTDIDLTEIGRLAIEGVTPSEDMQATGTYRREAAQVLVQRVIAEALERAGGA